MVRLENNSAIYSISLPISIPSGAIKSYSLALFTSSKHISIHSGANKRISYLRINCISFQFLLVRLREPALFLFKITSKISIPSGAIKSLLWLQQCLHCFFISIPSGAIKSSSRFSNSASPSLFQFLLVRLRED
jgi:hypothetical protein